MALNISSEVAIRWKDCDAKYVPLLKEGGITMVLAQSRNEAFESGCREAGIKVKPLDEIKFSSLASIGSAPPRSFGGSDRRLVAGGAPP